ncbi:hypothetical protein EMPS_02544 [Entomortierella parvispora]|uniref:Uncharacterized protein n=1 Tax=Entomortierella parvispora TaxID=205924 RepID=A0A9P3LU16_9FUNG|nr:hypothetical protein EMPS_02544 [Entomortierella parvispora]
MELEMRDLSPQDEYTPLQSLKQTFYRLFMIMPNDDRNPLLQAPMQRLRGLCIAIGLFGVLCFIVDLTLAIAVGEATPLAEYGPSPEASSTVGAIVGLLFVPDVIAILVYGFKLRRHHRPLSIQRRDLNLVLRVFFLIFILIMPCMDISTFQEHMRYRERHAGYNDADLFFVASPLRNN